jgi:hypothetical protein
MSPFAFISDEITTGITHLFNFCSQHPELSGAIGSWFALCFLTSCIVRGIYPGSKWKRDERPTVARILLLMVDPFVGNLWYVFEWLFNRVGIKLPIPPPMDVTITIVNPPSITS